MAKQKGWLDKYGEEINANEGHSSAPKEWIGEGYSNVGRNYSPAWGGQFKDGGNILQAQKGLSFLPEQDPEMMYTDRFNTSLNEEESNAFNDWVAKESERQGRNILMDKGAYDVQGFWKSGDYKKMDQDNHGTDTWKKPNHPTFSNQSRYHGIDGFYGGNWTNEAGYQPSKQTASTYGPSYYSRLFAEEPNRPEHLDASRYMSGTNRPSPLYYAMGGSLPGSVGFMYARTNSPAPSNGPYAKKTKASAENGIEMSYYQNGLDWKPKSISKNGSEVPKAQTGNKVCGPNQVYLEGRGCIDIASQEYKDAYAKGVGSYEKYDKAQNKWLSANQDDPDAWFVTNKATLPIVTIQSKRTEAQKAALLRKEMQERSAQNQTQISSADQPWYQRAWDIATHPGTAIRAYNETGYVPSNLSAAAENMGGSSSVINTLSPFTWAKGAYNATKQFGSAPIQTTQDVIQGAGNLLGYGIHSIDRALPGQTMPEYTSPFGDVGTNKRALEFVGNVGDAVPLLELAGPIANLSKTALRESVDLVSPVGRELRAVKKYGKLNNLTEAEIKNMQMQKVGITSKQREGYFPGASEILSEYLTPYGYENMGKRLLNIPKRIIKGETNTKKIANNLVDVVMDQGQTLLSKPRYDAWRMYSGLPQEYGTFRLAETSPLNHSSYPKGSLDNTEIFSLNDERRLLNDVPNKNDLSRYHYSNEDLVDDLDYLKRSHSDLDKLNNSTKIYATDFGTTNVMGGHNRRFFDNKMEYNDIWDLNPGNLQVDKYFGKPFMSHGQVPYNINDIQSELRNFIKQGERLKEYPNIKVNPLKNRLFTDKWNNLNNTIPNYSTVVKKQKEGGVVKDDNGYWNPDNWGKVVEIDSPDITMEGVDQDLIGISDEGDVQYMTPGKDYKFKGKKVREYPVGKNGVNQQDEKVAQQLDQLTNFTNYNKPTKGGWLDKYN